MSHHLNLLRTIFQDPVSGNIHWREIESLLHHLGATVEPSHGARFRVVLNNVEGILHHPHTMVVYAPSKTSSNCGNTLSKLASAHPSPNLKRLRNEVRAHRNEQ